MLTEICECMVIKGMTVEDLIKAGYSRARAELMTNPDKIKACPYKDKK